MHRIGLIADSHGHNTLLRQGIAMLAGLGADQIIHLGDFSDSLRPHCLAEAIAILKEHGVQALRGNNEHTLLNSSASNALTPSDRGFLEALPYTIASGRVSFAHSAPFDWPAATCRPIEYFLPFLKPGPGILFRGHSHQPQILIVPGDQTQPESVPPDAEVALDAEARYVVTVGALETGCAAFFDESSGTVRFLRL